MKSKLSVITLHYLQYQKVISLFRLILVAGIILVFKGNIIT